MISTRRLKSRTTKPTKGSQPVLECRFAFVVTLIRASVSGRKPIDF